MAAKSMETSSVDLRGCAANRNVRVQLGRSEGAGVLVSPLFNFFPAPPRRHALRGIHVRSLVWNFSYNENCT